MPPTNAGSSGTTAHYSLNREDGIENDAINRPLTPEEILEQKQLREEVYAALMKLPAIQARRIYARFYLGMTVAEIARIEGTTAAVCGTASGAG